MAADAALRRVVCRTNAATTKPRRRNQIADIALTCASAGRIKRSTRATGLSEQSNMSSCATRAIHHREPRTGDEPGGAENSPVRGNGFGLVGDAAIGIVGALIGDWLLRRLGVHFSSGVLGLVINATIGAIVR